MVGEHGGPIVDMSHFSAATGIGGRESGHLGRLCATSLWSKQKRIDDGVSCVALFRRILQTVQSRSSTSHAEPASSSFDTSLHASETWSCQRLSEEHAALVPRLNPRKLHVSGMYTEWSSSLAPSDPPNSSSATHPSWLQAQPPREADEESLTVMAAIRGVRAEVSNSRLSKTEPKLFDTADAHER